MQIVKCKDINCCSPPRSTLFSILPDRFLPPPVPIVSNGHNLDIDFNKGKFFNLSWSQILMNSVKDKFPQYSKLPYDVACPSLQNIIPKRLCKKCGLYIASLSKLKDHQKACCKAVAVTKVRPEIICAKRNREMLAAIMYAENELEYEWIDEECLDLNDALLTDECTQNDIRAPLIDIEQNLLNIHE